MLHSEEVRFFTLLKTLPKFMIHVILFMNHLNVAVSFRREENESGQKAIIPFPSHMLRFSYENNYFMCCKYIQNRRGKNKLESDVFFLPFLLEPRKISMEI